jgi:glycosyltransferase involved in cell wall biosynthesis
MPTSNEGRKRFANLRVAIVHYWLVGDGGGERVIEAIAEIFPQADLFTLVANRDTLREALRSRSLSTSFIQRIPGSRRWYRHFLPLYPFALEQFDLSGYDLVISSESGPAKGVLTSPQTLHVCYCHSPMRYLWDMYHQYRNGMGVVQRAVFSLAAHYVRMWDTGSATRVDAFVANSNYVASRIWKYYRRGSEVIYPPVDTSVGYISDQVGDHYLAVGRLVDYKRMDLAIAACKQLQRPLRIIGDGPDYKSLKRLAGPTVRFLGRLDDQGLRKNLASCRALLFPGEEDFGILPVEVQSFGRPVIAFGRGGVLETVIGLAADDLARPETSTGVFFQKQAAESLTEAIQRFEAAENRFCPQFIRSHAMQFDRERFKKEFARFVAVQLRQQHAAEQQTPHLMRFTPVTESRASAVNDSVRRFV